MNPHSGFHLRRSVPIVSLFAVAFFCWAKTGVRKIGNYKFARLLCADPQSMCCCFARWEVVVIYLAFYGSFGWSCVSGLQPCSARFSLMWGHNFVWNLRVKATHKLLVIQFVISYTRSWSINIKWVITLITLLEQMTLCILITIVFPHRRSSHF